MNRFVFVKNAVAILRDSVSFVGKPEFVRAPRFAGAVDFLRTLGLRGEVRCLRAVGRTEAVGYVRGLGFAGAAFVAAVGFLGAAASVQAKEARWEPTISKFEAKDAQTSPPKNGILFVGSSSVVGWKVEKFFPELPVINRGFGGSQVSDVVDYFDRVVAPYEPDTIVFYSGDNDIKGGKTTTTVFNDVKKFVQLVHENLPEARVILLPPKPSISRWNIYPEMKQVGELEKELADKDPKVEFLDIATPMLGADGKPKPELFLGDKLHMTEAGYVIWSDLLRPMLTDKATTGTQAN